MELGRGCSVCLSTAGGSDTTFETEALSEVKNRGTKMFDENLFNVYTI